jgi:hypothetical protein
MAGGGHTVEFRCPVQISDFGLFFTKPITGVYFLRPWFTQRLLEGEGEGNYFFTVRDFQTYV